MKVSTCCAILLTITGLALIAFSFTDQPTSTVMITRQPAIAQHHETLSLVAWARSLGRAGRWAAAPPPRLPVTTRPDLFERLRWHPRNPDGGGRWRWDPNLLAKVIDAANDPNVPIADDGSLLARLRGRSILFLGDSLDRNVLYRFVGCVEDTLLNHSASGGARCRGELIDYGEANAHVLLHRIMPPAKYGRASVWG